MKKLFLFLLVIVFLPGHFAHGQMLVLDATVAGLIKETGFEQAILYGQLIAQAVEQASLIKTQIEHTAYMAYAAGQNLISADINSYGDFMDWYNRQLYLERKSIEAFQSMNVTIGNKKYSLMDIEGMAGGLNETYVEYWEKEFTEEQRREMWLSLGLTPANYAYVQPFRARGNELAREFLAASAVQNNEYMQNMQKNKERQDLLANDKNLEMGDKMGEKEILMLILESSMENNKTLNDIAMYQAREMELRAVEMYLDRAPADQPAASENFLENKVFFRRLD